MRSAKASPRNRTAQGPQPPRADDGDLFRLWCEQSLQTLGVQARAHRGSEPGEPGFDAAAFESADLLTVRFADGSVLHTHPVDWADRYDADLVPARSGDAGSHGRICLPFDIATGAAATRGDGARLQVDSYELARLTPSTALDKLFDLGARIGDRVDRWLGQAAPDGAGALAARLCRAFEDAALHPAVPRPAAQASGCLLHWAGTGWLPLEGAVGRGAGSVVLLLHGTASSTEGSFGGLWQGAGGAPAAGPWLPQGAGGAPLLLAFEHRSLTASPLQNVLHLVQALADLGLADGARITLLSHSRGGLVGELLSLMLAGAGAEPADPAARHARVLATLDRAYGAGHPDQPLLAELATACAGVRARGWQAADFVRVACPARGTLLADRRTDLFLSLLLRSVELGFGLSSPWYARVAGLVKGLVAARADARRLPGLEAMIPGSPLTVALNAMPPELRLPGRLRVVAGDAQAKGWGGLLTVLGDLFYGLHDHDFVVHTHAMFGGVARSDALSLRVEDASVTHFGYFKPGSLTRRAVLAALEGEAAGFNPLADDEARTRGLLQLLSNDRSRRSWAEWKRRMDDAGGPARPLLLFLPGIMGSELSAPENDGGHLVWLSLPAMLTAGLSRLEPGCALQASGVMSVAYERLLAQAEKSFHVFTLPFDWRDSIERLGRSAAARIDELLDWAAGLSPPQPVHVLAHSMGGLVARRALEAGQADAPRWQRFTRAGGRLLMLGTPNRGSYAPAQLLLQQHMAARLVAMGSVGIDAQDLARFGARYPGLLAMLPHDPDPAYGDLYAAAAWDRAALDDAGLVLPEPDTLAQARADRDWLHASFGALSASDHALYVAGHAPTPLHLRSTGGPSGPALRLGVSDQGDGTVPWTSCLAPERTWYVDAAHGDLADEPSAFEAYFELLRHGDTRRLTQVPPSARGAEDLKTALFPLPALPSLPPDAAAAVLGVSPRSGQALAWVPPTEIRVVHGSLDYARFPLVVGHYANDGVHGAVQRVDQKLDGLLLRQIELDLVTGKSGTATYVRPKSRDGSPPAYPGAIVVGLGAVGELTPAALTDSVTRGVLRFAVEHVSQDTWAPAEGPLLLQLSTLLVGTHVQALSKRDSLAAVLLGVWRAGQLLADGQALGGRPARVTEVELIEIEEPVALDAAYALQSLLQRPEWAQRYHWSRPLLESRDGGLRGFRPSATDTLWQRLLVREDALGGLRFELIAERARVESTQVHADVASLRQYIDRVSDEGAVAGRRPEEEQSIGRVLFQLLLPQLLKSRMANFDRTVIVVDERTAALPWELLTPPQRSAADAEAAQPLSVQGGMVRQRITPSFRAAPPLPPDWTALVVGDPSTEGWTDAAGRPLRFAALPGAAAEAAEVARLLRADARPWQVDQLERGATFETVRTALLRRPSRVLHLAGHGVVDQWQRSESIDGDGRSTARREVRRTGLLLSHQQVLSAGDVEQMDPAPDFVFINGCWTGREGEAGFSRGNQPAQLASGLALQFIQMGSKAVVAAGWRVHDDDALRFAQVLYTGLLQGQTFGAAVLEARREVYRLRRSNTWGAYQCYGDPEWRLVDGNLGGRNDVGSRGSSRLRGAERCMSPSELAERIEQAVQVAGDKPTADLVRQLQDLAAALGADGLRSGWLQDSRVATAFGGAFRELGRYEDSWRWYRQAAAPGPSHLQLRHLELAARTLTRLGAEGRTKAGRLLQAMEGVDAVLAGAAEGERTPAAATRDVIEGSRLAREALDGLDTPGVAADALAASARARAVLLLRGAACYGSAYDEASRSQPADIGRRAYTLANAVLLTGMAALLDRDALQAAPEGRGWSLGAAEGPQGTLSLCAGRSTQALLDELERHVSGGEFWDYTNAYELRLARSVLRLGLDQVVDEDDLARLVPLMRSALVRWPSPVELQSLRFNIGAIGRLIVHVRAQGRGAVAAAALEQVVAVLHDEMTGHTVGGGAVG